jgi:outer membrane protein assembly factor BamB
MQSKLAMILMMGLFTVFLTANCSGAESPEGVKGASAQWHQWRGPTGQGHSADARVPLTWSERENLLWKTPLPGRGNSSPIVWGDRVFLTAASPDGKERYVLCVSARDGSILWQRLAAKDPQPDKVHEWNGYASPSCTTDGEHVYAFFGTPGLFCYDNAGNLVWHHRYGIFTTETGWGVGASPFLFGDLVIQNCDNDGAAALPAGHKPEDAAPAALVALDKRTGKVLWSTPRDQGRGFSTPRLRVTPRGQPELVLNGPKGVWAYDPQTGKQRWHVDRTAPGEQARFGEPLPVSAGDMLYAVSGRPGPFQAIRLSETDGGTRADVVWQVARKDHRDVASPVLANELFFQADNKGFLTCHDPKTGAVLFNQRITDGAGKSLGSPVFVRGKLLVPLDDGTTVVIDPERTLKVAGENRLGNGHALEFGASPAIAEGRLYLRSQTHLYCVGEKK